MKKFLSLTILSLVAFGCVTMEEYVVDYDYSYKGKFGKYRTYDFVSKSDLEFTAYDELIEGAIQTRLSTQGYRNSQKKPNLLVLYKVYFEDFYMNAYDQPELENWVKDVQLMKKDDLEVDLSLDELTDEELEEEEQIKIPRDYNSFKCDLREGTLYIVLFDRRSRQSVWQGYASGLFGNENFNNKKSIKKAVASILDEYQVLAKGFDQFNP